MAAAAILDNFEWPYLRNGYLHSAHRAVIFAIAQLFFLYDIAAMCVLKMPYNPKHPSIHLSEQFCPRTVSSKLATLAQSRIQYNRSRN